MGADELKAKGKLLKSEWDSYKGVDDKVFIGLTETYLYKENTYYIDYIYQPVTKKDYDYIPENVEKE